MRTLPSPCPRTDTLSNHAAGYKPERNRAAALPRRCRRAERREVTGGDSFATQASGLAHLRATYEKYLPEVLKQVGGSAVRGAANNGK